MAFDLRDKYGALGMKMSTEDMGDSFEDINIIANKVLANAFPVYVKIGGPNARGDLKQIQALGLTGVIAPMVESPYALKEYIVALRTIFPRNVLDHMLRGINAETVTCYTRLDDILAIPEVDELNHISVGRGDLGKSVGETMDGPQTLKMTRDMVHKIKALGIPVSVSTPTPASAQNIANTIQPDKINAAHVYISVKDTENITEAFKQALLFENALTRYRYSRVNHQAITYQNIIAARKTRLKGGEAALHT
jgi:2-keto-3-deoxy-L-rhamnonate aldolase RhmA